MGGRKKGTPNKVSSDVKESIQALVENYTSGKMLSDLEEVGPEVRLRTMIQLAKLIVPRPIPPQYFEEPFEIEVFIGDEQVK